MDKNIFDDVTWKLKTDSRIDDTRIVVGVKDGVVTLTGHVKRYSDKGYAEEDVKSVNGVLGIAEELIMDFLGLCPRTDTEIADTVIKALGWEVSFNEEHKIQVVVEDGNVTLTGELDYHYQKERAFENVHYLKGVKNVKNNITIRKLLNVSDIMNKIKETFLKSARIDAENIAIKVDGNKVTLEGEVRSWFEHDEARKIAYSIPGVQRVVNCIRVSP